MQYNIDKVNSYFKTIETIKNNDYIDTKESRFRPLSTLVQNTASNMMFTSRESLKNMDYNNNSYSFTEEASLNNNTQRSSVDPYQSVNSIANRLHEKLLEKEKKVKQLQKETLKNKEKIVKRNKNLNELSYYIE